MGLFSKPLMGNYGDYEYEITFRKCVGYFGGKIQYFWGVKDIKLIKEKSKTQKYYRATIPDEFMGLPVLVICDRALKNTPPVAIGHTKIIAISCNQGGTSGMPPRVSFEGAHEHWVGAIFTYDENHELFKPLDFVPSDITYGCIAQYYQKDVRRSSLTEYCSWLLEQLSGDGKDVSHNNNGLYSFIIFGKGKKPDWSSQCRFLVKDPEKNLPLAYKYLDEIVTHTFKTF